MTIQIGFLAERKEKKELPEQAVTGEKEIHPRKSVVRVQFPEKGMALAYYNDRFDLQPGDRVYVEGKMAGIQGRVTEVSYNFKIKTAAYKRIIAVVDTEVRGELFLAGSHFAAFDPAVLPYEQVRSWFKAPPEKEAEYITGHDGYAFPLADLSRMKVSDAAGQRGYAYYLDNKVRYICISGTRGRAIVEGSEAYEVEFRYREGQISELTCDCPCIDCCKHQVAAMLQLRDTLGWIEKHYPEKLEDCASFCAIFKPTLFLYAIDGKETGRMVL